MARKRLGTKKIYLDHAASTPVDSRVLRAMQPYFSARFGNPGSLHAYGQEAMAAVDASRARIAEAMKVSFRDILFTSSATEANNLALQGVVRHAMAHGIERPRVIVSAGEHESVLAPARALAAIGADLVIIPISKEGGVDRRALADALTPATVLVSIIYVSNELGAVAPLRAIAGDIAAYKAKAPRGSASPYPLFHTDAAQAFRYFSCLPHELGVDLMTLSGQKIGGPKGIGCLYAREAVHPFITPLCTGGGQELGLRAGTENVPAIVGFAEAIARAVALRTSARKHVASVVGAFLGAMRELPDVAFQGPLRNFRKGSSVLSIDEASPHIVSVLFSGHNAADMLMALDMRGIAVSSGSACDSRAERPSHVITSALGAKAAAETLRFSFGPETTLQDVRAAARALKDILQKSL